MDRGVRRVARRWADRFQVGCGWDVRSLDCADRRRTADPAHRTAGPRDGSAVQPGRTMDRVRSGFRRNQRARHLRRALDRRRTPPAHGPPTERRGRVVGAQQPHDLLQHRNVLRQFDRRGRRRDGGDHTSGGGRKLGAVARRFHVRVHAKHEARGRRPEQPGHLGRARERRGRSCPDAQHVRLAGHRAPVVSRWLAAGIHLGPEWLQQPRRDRRGEWRRHDDDHGGRRAQRAALVPGRPLDLVHEEPRLRLPHLPDSGRGRLRGAADRRGRG